MVDFGPTKSGVGRRGETCGRASCDVNAFARRNIEIPSRYKKGALKT